MLLLFFLFLLPSSFFFFGILFYIVFYRKYDFDWFESFLYEQVFCFLGFICIVSSSVQASNFRACFYNTIIWLSFLATSILAGMHLFHIGRETIFKLNARKFECCVNAGLAFGCFIAAAVTVSLDVAAYAAATVCPQHHNTDKIQIILIAFVVLVFVVFRLTLFQPVQHWCLYVLSFKSTAWCCYTDTDSIFSSFSTTTSNHLIYFGIFIKQQKKKEKNIVNNCKGKEGNKLFKYKLVIFCKWNN